MKKHLKLSSTREPSSSTQAILDQILLDIKSPTHSPTEPEEVSESEKTSSPADKIELDDKENTSESPTTSPKPRGL